MSIYGPPKGNAKHINGTEKRRYISYGIGQGGALSGRRNSFTPERALQRTFWTKMVGILKFIVPLSLVCCY